MPAKSEVHREALNLPARERIDLVVPVPEWQRELIRERLAELEDIPSGERSVPWEAVRRRALSTRRGAGGK